MRGACAERVTLGVKQVDNHAKKEVRVRCKSKGGTLDKSDRNSSTCATCESTQGLRGPSKGSELQTSAMHMHLRAVQHVEKGISSSKRMSGEKKRKKGAYLPTPSGPIKMAPLLVGVAGWDRP